MSKVNTPAVPLQDQIISAISWTLNLAPYQLTPYTHFTEDLHLDQIDLTLLIAAVESQLDVYLSTEEVADIKTVADLNRYFSKYSVNSTSSSVVSE